MLSSSDWLSSPGKQCRKSHTIKTIRGDSQTTHLHLPMSPPKLMRGKEAVQGHRSRESRGQGQTPDLGVSSPELLYDRVSVAGSDAFQQKAGNRVSSASNVT